MNIILLFHNYRSNFPCVIIFLIHKRATTHVYIIVVSFRYVAQKVVNMQNCCVGNYVTKDNNLTL